MTRDMITEYAARVADGTLRADAAQEAALPELERIRVALAEPVKRGWFAKKPEPIRGLYMWGGVGRGKRGVEMAAGDLCRVHADPRAGAVVGAALAVLPSPFPVSLRL